MDILKNYASRHAINYNELLADFVSSPKEEQEAFLMQIGGEQEGSGDINELLSAYAQLAGIPFEELMVQFDSLPDQQKQAFIDQALAAVYQANNPTGQEEQMMAQTGVPVTEQGYYELDPLEDPYAYVPTPDGSITMQGIDYPINAYDGNTGQFLDQMQPGEDYYFDTDLVLEEPVYTQVGRVVDKAWTKYMKATKPARVFSGAASPGLVNNKENELSGDPLWEDFVEIFDPTGISSWDDVSRAFKAYKNDPSMMNAFGVGLEGLGAVPVVGKGAKIVSQGGKWASRLARAGRAVDLVGDATSIGLTGAGLIYQQTGPKVYDINSPIFKEYAAIRANQAAGDGSTVGRRLELEKQYMGLADFYKKNKNKLSINGGWSKKELEEFNKMARQEEAAKNAARVEAESKATSTTPTVVKGSGKTGMTKDEYNEYRRLESQRKKLEADEIKLNKMIAAEEAANKGKEALELKKQRQKEIERIGELKKKIDSNPNFVKFSNGPTVGDAVKSGYGAIGAPPPPPRPKMQAKDAFSLNALPGKTKLSKLAGLAGGILGAGLFVEGINDDFGKKGTNPPTPVTPTVPPTQDKPTPTNPAAVTSPADLERYRQQYQEFIDSIPTKAPENTSRDKNPVTKKKPTTTTPPVSSPSNLNFLPGLPTDQELQVIADDLGMKPVQKELTPAQRAAAVNIGDGTSDAEWGSRVSPTRPAVTSTTTSNTQQNNVPATLARFNVGTGIFGNLLRNSKAARAFGATAPVFRGQARLNFIEQPLIDFQPIADGVRSIFNDAIRNINSNSTSGAAMISYLQSKATDDLTKAVNQVNSQNNRINAMNNQNRVQAANQLFERQQALDMAAYDQQLRRSAARDLAIDNATAEMIAAQEAANERKVMFDTLPLLHDGIEDISNPFDRLIGRRKYAQNRNYKLSYTTKNNSNA